VGGGTAQLAFSGGPATAPEKSGEDPPHCRDIEAGLGGDRAVTEASRSELPDVILFSFGIAPFSSKLHSGFPRDCPAFLGALDDRLSLHLRRIAEDPHHELHD